MDLSKGHSKCGVGVIYPNKFWYDIILGVLSYSLRKLLMDNLGLNMHAALLFRILFDLDYYLKIWYNC